jgi:hypothetical protein
MQGRYIEHQALAAAGHRERITMITALRPRDPWVRDEAVVSKLRGISPAAELFVQYADYRLANLEARVRQQRARMRMRRGEGREVDWDAGRVFLTAEREFLDGLLAELETCARG